MDTLDLNIALIPLNGSRRFYATRLDDSMRNCARRVRAACARVAAEHGRAFVCRVATYKRLDCVKVTRTA